MVINAAMFCGLLDNLAGSFFREGSALCASAEGFAGQLSKDAQEFFSIVIEYSEDLGKYGIVGVLIDDTKKQGGKNTYTFVIFVNREKFQGESQKIALAVLFSHEICHFAFYYELFLRLGGVKSSNVYNDFKNKISESISQTVIDVHSFTKPIDMHAVYELIESLGNYPVKHFTRGNQTEIDYHSFFFHLLRHQNII